MGKASRMAYRHVAEWKEAESGSPLEQRLTIERAHFEFEMARDELDLFDRASFVEEYMAASESLSEDASGARKSTGHRKAGHRKAGHRKGCPLCGCRRAHATRAGFGVGKAVVGAALFGVAGLAAGFIGACDETMTCLACGNTWQPGLGG
ncbi:MAG TPA: hypothetical protein VFK31_00540 [Rhodanobacteraceae bacterium]|nr:hypothetical protein [Rhodanobacteraceae bacterium]